MSEIAQTGNNTQRVFQLGNLADAMAKSTTMKDKDKAARIITPWGMTPRAAAKKK